MVLLSSHRYLYTLDTPSASLGAQQSLQSQGPRAKQTSWGLLSHNCHRSSLDLLSLALLK